MRRVSKFLRHEAVLLLACLAFPSDGIRAQSKEKTEIVPQIPHSSFVTSLAFSPDGALVLSGNRDATLKLWNAASGTLVRTFEGHVDQVRSVVFSPDGGRVLSGSWDETLKLGCHSSTIDSRSIPSLRLGFQAYRGLEYRSFC